ncbi:MAG: chorismate mutase [Oscillospiraceae bacterium]
MELKELRAQIDEIDRALIALLEQRMDVAAGVADYKIAHNLPVLDASREVEKYAAIRAQCRPETADHIESVFVAALAASRAYQQARMEKNHGE